MSDRYYKNYFGNWTTKQCGNKHQMMPPGYELSQLDSGHWIYVHIETDIESCIHWDRWAIYRGAWKAHREGRHEKETTCTIDTVGV